MEKLLHPLKHEGFTEEIWKSLTAAPEEETDLLSDGEGNPSPQLSPTARGIKRTVDGEAKHVWVADSNDFPTIVKVQSPPGAVPIEAQGGNVTDEDDEEFRANMYIPISIWLNTDRFRLCIFRNIWQRRISPIVMYHTSFSISQLS